LDVGPPVIISTEGILDSIVDGLIVTAVGKTVGSINVKRDGIDEKVVPLTDPDDVELPLDDSDELETTDSLDDDDRLLLELKLPDPIEE